MKPEGLRRFTGFKYYRVTGGEGEKLTYDPAKGLERARVHARDFLFKRMQQCMDIGRFMKRPPSWPACMTPNFLATGGSRVLISSASFSRRPCPGNAPAIQYSFPNSGPTLSSSNGSASSFFLGVWGYSEFWLNEANDWVYPLLVKHVTA